MKGLPLYHDENALSLLSSRSITSSWFRRYEIYGSSPQLIRNPLIALERVLREKI